MVRERVALTEFAWARGDAGEVRGGIFPVSLECGRKGLWLDPSRSFRHTISTSTRSSGEHETVPVASDGRCLVVLTLLHRQSTESHSPGSDVRFPQIPYKIRHGYLLSTLSFGNSWYESGQTPIVQSIVIC